jgi:hypothetical protein
MKSTFLFIIYALILISCGSDHHPNKADLKIIETPIEIKDSVTIKLPDTVQAVVERVDSLPTVKVKFIEFFLGDAAHYEFEDSSGIGIEFSGNNSENFKFARELERNE